MRESLGKISAKARTRSKNRLEISLPPLRPIKTKADHKKSLELILQLGQLRENGQLAQPEIDYLEVLIILASDWEAKRYSFGEETTPLNRLQFLLEQHGLSASDLGRILGHRELGSRVLRGERELSKKNVRVLADYFNVDPGCFI